MLKNQYTSIRRNLSNIKGWRTNRKILVIESDDWGSIRMPSREVYHELLNAGIRVNECSYDRCDSIESEQDLEFLFDVLSEFRDSYGNPPVITANMLMTNPDFEKIRRSGFSEYYYELFTETYKKYPHHSNSFSILKQGLAEKLFFPQFHGREHLNIKRWMSALRKGLPETMFAFDLKVFGLSTSVSNEKRKSYLQAYGLDEVSEIEEHKKIISEGLTLFKNTFGFTARSFMAPNYTWHYDLDPVLSDSGVRYFQGNGYRNIPIVGGYKSMRYSLGQRNIFNQIYLKRNCLFEPSEFNADWINSCLKEISIAFFWNKPAIIASHRVNYIGSIAPNNRDLNLRLLRTLLKKVINHWPEVEFMTSERLGDIISLNN